MSISIPSGINACNNDTGDRSTVFGIGSTSSGVGTFAAGIGVTASKPGQVALGAYNDPDDDSILSIGAGTGPSDRKTALKVNSDGSVEISDGKVVTTPVTAEMPTTVSWDSKFANVKYARSTYDPWLNHNDQDVYYWKDTTTNKFQAFLYSPRLKNDYALQVPSYYDSSANVLYMMPADISAGCVSTFNYMASLMSPWTTKFGGILHYITNSDADHYAAMTNKREIKGCYHYGSNKFVIPTTVSGGVITASVDYDASLYRVDYIYASRSYNYTNAKDEITIKYTTLATGTSNTVTWDGGSSSNQAYTIPCIAALSTMPMSYESLDVAYTTGNSLAQTVSTDTVAKTYIMPTLGNSVVIDSPYTDVTGSDNEVHECNSGHVEGGYNVVWTDPYTHVEGHGNYVCGNLSEYVINHVEGAGNHLEAARYGHCEGGHNFLAGSYNHVEGYHNESSGNYQHVSGKYNSTYAGAFEIVGMGTSSNRKNARLLDSNGCEQARGFLPLNTCSTVADLPSSGLFQGMMYLVGGTKLCIYLGSSWQQFTLATPASEE